ncbi:hypothetical protein ERO13_A12G159200v2 [Gossypium hirsutum]|uniref:Transcription factor BIM2 isoform X2 n=1 Tax=Gossypium hirsutum TaxID=3635 RepID=A0A1U8M7L7_GOSHI|nr:transcription factor BIM2 isoform X2 [Gossypium hirsutum]KAG4170633.1 hypothetical protein ERO13_A12G159200v2 [Gossypium hirsutum]KAG4170634.1 hypothetical protein ERO13_A12G159200v2 [Gossypium hirsutum]
MRRGKASQEEEEFGSKKTRPSSFHTLSVNANTNTNTNINNDGKDSDKAKAIRSKHSVTEQRRRSKINERFQILRDLIPNTDQKRDTASFLLEVIEYVQFLQEKVQKYEGSYQGWSSEPTKLKPWRNSHWRGQSFVDHTQAIKNDPGLGSTFSGKLDEKNINISPSMIASALDSSEADPVRDNEQAELAVPIQGGHPLQRPVSEAQKCLTSNDTLNQQDDLAIEGGTISISSVYSQGLLNTLTQALQRTGLDLSQANISVQIDLGKRCNRGLTSSAKESANGEDSNPVQKRLKK